MEKKTMGSFIAKLRKANGMTQKELAEKLHVSDKSISRWERDETAPDLTIIPVIAEMFDVTSDELLKGERNKSNVTESIKSAEKKEKQLKYILNKNKSNFNIKSIIAIGLVILSAIIYLYPTYSYTFENFKPMMCTCITIIALILEITFIVSAYNAVADEEFDIREINDFKVYMVKVLKIIVFACVFSLLSILVLDSLPVLSGIILVLVFAYYISFVANLFIDWVVGRKNIFRLSEEIKCKQQTYNKITAISFGIVFILWFVLFVTQS